MQIKGRCACGAVTFEATGPPRWQGYCHCPSCQTAHAAPMTAVAMFSAGDVTVRGETAPLKVTAEPRATVRHACLTCGTKVVNEPHPKLRAVMVALCEERAWFTPQLHLWWSTHLVDVADDLPKYLDFPEDFGGSGRTA